MSKINIISGGSNNDSHYRYKMQALKIKQETNFTILLNIDQVADDLKRDIGSILKFFGYSFGTRAKYDKKRKAGSLQGTFTKKQLEETLQGYIEDFVLCSKCKLPETEFKFNKKKETLKLKCAACGEKSKVKGDEKVISYLVKQL